MNGYTPFLIIKFKYKYNEKSIIFNGFYMSDRYDCGCSDTSFR